MKRTIVALASVLVLGGCVTSVPALIGMEPEARVDGRLDRVLTSAEETPGKQGLLYVAMAEAEVAAQNTGRALAVETLEEIKTAIGGVLFAIEPDRAPRWSARSAGIVQVWDSTGYGMVRAVTEMRKEIRGLAAGRNPAVVEEYAPKVLACLENTLARAERLVALSRQVLAADVDTALSGLLTQMHALARALNQGSDIDDDGTVAADEGECGLQQAELYLDRMVLREELS